MQVRVRGGEGAFRARLWGSVSVPATDSIHRHWEQGVCGMGELESPRVCSQPEPRRGLQSAHELRGLPEPPGCLCEQGMLFPGGFSFLLPSASHR